MSGIGGIEGASLAMIQMNALSAQSAETAAAGASDRKIDEKKRATEIRLEAAEQRARKGAILGFVQAAVSAVAACAGFGWLGSTMKAAADSIAPAATAVNGGFSAGASYMERSAARDDAVSAAQDLGAEIAGGSEQRSKDRSEQLRQRNTEQREALMRNLDEYHRAKSPSA